MATDEGTLYPAWSVARDARHRTELTLEQLSERSGVSPARLDAIERADVSPTAGELGLIAQACGLELRMVLEKPDPQRQAHRDAAMARTPTERVAANSSGVNTFRVLRAAGKAGPITNTNQ
jgi:transcriptional regulator with XRE-family HTH domain